MTTMYTDPTTYHSLPTGDFSPPIIALTGFAQSGKDLTALFLARYGYHRLALADPIREGLYALNPIIQSDNRGRVYRLRSVVDELSWEGAKANPEVRDLLQRYGTEGGRSLFGEDVWVRLLLSKMLPGERYVVTDCRFENEANILKGAGGHIVRVLRKGVGPVNAHVSDRGLPHHLVDRVICNYGDVKHLRSQVALLMDSYR